MATKMFYLVSNERLAHMAQELHLRTGDRETVSRALAAAQLNDRDLVAPEHGSKGHKIDFRKEARFLQAAVAIVDDASFAAEIGSSFKHDTSVSGYVAKYSKDVRQALETAQKYTVLADEHFSYRLQVSSNATSLFINSAVPAFEFGDRIREFIIFSVLRALRTIANREFHPLEIRFEHAAPSAAAAIRRLAGAPVVFDAEDTEMILASSTLDLPIPTYDPRLLSYLADYGNGLLEKIDQPEPDLRARIEALLVEGLPQHLLTATEVATALGMGRRTLMRRLADADVSFSAIVEDVRCALAKTYLIQSQTPIAEVAFLLDYADQAAFSTAFRRWTGATPRAFRAEQCEV